MKSKANLPALGLSVLLAIGLAVIMNMKKAVAGDIALVTILFFVLNFLLLVLIFRSLPAIFKVLRLPGIRLRTYAYHLYPAALLVIYAAFIIVILRIARMNVPEVLLFASIAGSIVLILLAQLGGAFPQKRMTPKKDGYRIDGAGGSLGGFEILGSMYGEYQQGIVLGTDIIDYGRIEKIHRSQDVLVLEGSAMPQLEIILVTERAKRYFAELLAGRLGADKERLLAPDREGARNTGSAGTGKEPARHSDLKRSKPVKALEAQKKRTTAAKPVKKAK